MKEKELIQKIKKYYKVQTYIYKVWQGFMSGSGFPDLILIKDKILFIEVKIYPNIPTPIQKFTMNLINQNIDKNCGEAFWVNDLNWQEEIKKRIEI